jgi:hypothetical protein
MQFVVPKDNDAFIGENGTVMNGSKILSSFTQEGNYWVATGQTQYGQLTGECLGGYNCTDNEDLFIDDMPLSQMNSLSLVTDSTKWWFDHANFKIYFLRNPNEHKVETSMPPVS